MKRAPKTLLRILAVTMALSMVLAGCTTATPTPAPAATPAPVATATVAATPAAENPFKDPMEISIAYWDIATAIPDDGKADPLYDMLKQKFNITIKPINTTWSDWEDKINLWASSGDLPDVFADDTLGKPQYSDWVKNGVVRALPTDLSLYPDLKKAMDDPRSNVFLSDGKYYAVPRIQYSDATHMTGPVIIARKDYLQAAGYTTPPTNVDDFITLFTKMIGKNLDGKANVVPLTSVNLNFPFQFIMYAYNPAYFYNGGQGNTAYVFEGGKWIPAFFSTKTLDGIKALKKLYQSGVIDKDFMINANSANGQAKFDSGNAAAMLGGVDPNTLNGYATAWNKNNPDKSFADNMVILPQWKAEDGNYYQYEETFWSESYFAAGVSDAKMSRICYLYDYLYSQQGKDLFSLGIEGTDYTRSGDQITITRAKNADGTFVGLSSLYPITGMMPFLATWYGDFNWANPSIDPKINKLSNDYLAWAKDNSIKVADADLSLPSFSAPLKDKFAYNAGNDDIIKIVLGTEDPDKMWADMMKKYEDAGYTQMVDELNANAKAAGAIK